MKAISRISVSLVAVVSFAASAGAAQFSVQAGSGHPHISSGVHFWTNEFDSTQSTWQIEDGRTIIRKPPSSGASTASWDVPLPVPVTGGLWKSTGQASTNGSDFIQRICAFDSNGNFSNCGASTNSGVASSVTVPSFGSVYSQSTITSHAGAAGTKFFHAIATNI